MIPFEGVEYQKTYSFDSIADKLYMKMHNMTIKTEILRENQIHIDEHCYYVDTEYIIYPIPYVNTICRRMDLSITIALDGRDRALDSEDAEE